MRFLHFPRPARRWVVAGTLSATLTGAAFLTGPYVTARAAAATGTAGASTSGTSTSLAPRTAAAPTVHVSGNQLVDGSGQPLRLLGVDRSGTEYACVQGWGIFDGPSDQASVDAIAAWHVNAVRVPLNEDCWLGVNGVNPAYSGANYRSAIQAYVKELHADGMVAVVDLHWNAPGGQLATGQQISADSDHSPAFWSSVATTLKSDPGVVFDLYNEPHDTSWDCWLNGCWNANGWHSAGMQDLLNAVRATGATQPVLAAGLNWGGDLSQWLAWMPTDPAHQLAASAHIYNFSQCNTAACWSQTLAPVAAKVPVVTGEIGENDCGSAFVQAYMSWADGQHISYLGWAWNTASCSGFPALITSYSGTPTPLGAGIQSHLAALASAQPTGGYVLGGGGQMVSFVTGSNASPAAASAAPGSAVRDLVMLPGGTGGYTLDGYGSLHPFALGTNPLPPTATVSASWPGWDIARSVTLLATGSGGYVLDGWGGVHPFALGSNPMPPSAQVTGYTPSRDTARDLVMLPGGTGGYTLDGYGSLHPFALGTNPLPPTASVSASWPGWDIARSVTLLPAGSGGYVLDGWGGIHPFALGTNPMPPAATVSAYWPRQDTARRIELDSDGAGGYVVNSAGVVAPFTTGTASMPLAASAVTLPAGTVAVGLALVG